MAHAIRKRELIRFKIDMAKIISLFLFLILVSSLDAQEADYLDLVKAESELHNLFSQLYSDSLSESGPILARIQKIMPVALTVDGGMEYPWSRLDKIGVIPSDDGSIRIFTWHVKESRDQYRYFGYIQVLPKKGKPRVYELKDNDRAQRNVQKLEQSSEDWYGKLYYKIITRKYKRKTYYTLLGMDFNNTRSTIKTIEAITVQRNKPQFTKGLFFDSRDRFDRVVLEYSTQVAISVRYDAGIQMITFDHLVPFHPIYKGNYEFYGPAGSYDGLEFEAGTWIYRQDIDVRNLN